MEVFKLKSEYTTLYFSNISPAVGSGLTNLSNRVNLETTTGMPDSAYFVTNLAPVRNTYTDYVVLQAHPPYFTAASFEQFKKVINYLTTQGYEFVLPYDYVRGKTQKAPTGLNAVSTGDGKVQLSWADNSPNEDMYQIEQSTDGTNWTFVGSASANATNYTISLPQTGDRYYFRVCASCGVKSGYTNIVEFVRTGIFNPNSKQSCIKVFPNPCNDIINIDLSLKENQNVNLELKNTAGKTLKTLFSGYLFPFQQPVSLDVSDVTKGVYFLVLTDSKGISDIQTLLIN
jgi:hypothetical protein